MANRRTGVLKKRCMVRFRQSHRHQASTPTDSQITGGQSTVAISTLDPRLLKTPQSDHITGLTQAPLACTLSSNCFFQHPAENKHDVHTNYICTYVRHGALGQPKQPTAKITLRKAHRRLAEQGPQSPPKRKPQEHQHPDSSPQRSPPTREICSAVDFDMESEMTHLKACSRQQAHLAIPELHILLQTHQNAPQVPATVGQHHHPAPIFLDAP